MTDKALLEGLRENDSKAIQYIIRKNWPFVRRLVTSTGGTVEEAEDVLMDSMEVICRKIKDTDFVLQAAFSTFLIAVCKNKWSNVLQHKKIVHREVTNDWKDILIEKNDIHAELELQERYVIYRKHWNVQGESCKRLLTFVFEGLSIAEITAALGFSSEGYTRKRKHLCKEKLVKSVRNDPEFGNY